MIKNHISALAFAKINLNLEIVGKRDNGYHDISTIMQSISLSDRLDVWLTDDKTVEVVTEKDLIKGENLVKKAAELFLNRLGSPKGVKVLLTKNIPLASGMGGGSANAAAVLICLNKLFGLPFSDNELAEMGLSIGADVPFCVFGGTKRAEGLGEVLTPVSDLPALKCLIIKNFDKTSTGEMYSKVDSLPYLKSNTEKIVSLINKCDINLVAPLCRNDFLTVSPQRCEQEKICNKLKEYGALLWGLSGSGPTVFGLFKTLDEQTINTFKSLYKEVYVCETVNSGIKIIE